MPLIEVKGAMKKKIFCTFVLFALLDCGKQKDRQEISSPKITGSEVPVPESATSRPLTGALSVGITKFSDPSNGSGFCSVVFIAGGFALVLDHCTQKEGKNQDFFAIGPGNISYPLMNKCKLMSKIQSNGEAFQVFYFSELKVAKGLIDLSSIKPSGMFGWAETLKLESVSEGFLQRSTNCFPTDSKSESFYEYSCDTIGGMSGALLRDSQGRPSAIHLGLKNGTAHGIALSALQNQIPDAQKIQQECNL